MAAVGVEEDPAVQAARILLTLRNRALRRRPEWVPKDPEPDQEAAPARVVVGEGGRVSFTEGSWPKGQRSGNRLPCGRWRSRFHAVSTGSGACSSGASEERWRERSTGRDELLAHSPVYCCAPAAGSGPSTSASADRKARPRHAAAVEMVVPVAGKAPSPAPVASVPPKERPMKAPSPETPLDFGAGSGASSSGDDAAGSTTPPKRKATGTVASAVGGGGASSSCDEECSSPDKRTRVDAAAAGHDGVEKKAISEPKVQQQTLDCEKAVKFEFDLNMPWPEDDDSPGFC